MTQEGPHLESLSRSWPQAFSFRRRAAFTVQLEATAICLWESPAWLNSIARRWDLASALTARASCSAISFCSITSGGERQGDCVLAINDLFEAGRFLCKSATTHLTTLIR